MSSLSGCPRATFRYVGGDLSSAEAFLSSPDVLGVDDTTYLGLEMTVYARLNTAQPFLRLTYFSDDDISGLSDAQVVLGVNVLSSIFKSEL